MRTFSASVLALSMIVLPFAAQAQSKPAPQIQLAMAGDYYDEQDGQMRHSASLAAHGGYRVREYRDSMMGYYVCYRKISMRGAETYSDGRYKGCMTSMRPCATIGRLHFGKYPSENAMYNALDRCQSNNPRFRDY